MTDQPLQYVAKTTPDLTQQQIERLKRTFPECVAERQQPAEPVPPTGQILSPRLPALDKSAALSPVQTTMNSRQRPQRENIA